MGRQGEGSSCCCCAAFSAALPERELWLLHRVGVSSCPSLLVGSGVWCGLARCSLCHLSGLATHALTSLSLQQAANIVRALELFVRPDLLGGENAYLCAK